MRRQFAWAFGGILAAAAAGTAQQPVPAKKTDVTVRPAGPATMLPSVEAVQVNEPIDTLMPGRTVPRSATGGAFLPLQPVQTYSLPGGQPAAGSPVQYIAIPVGPSANPAAVPAMTPAVQYVPVQAVTGQPPAPPSVTAAPALIATGGTCAGVSAPKSACTNPGCQGNCPSCASSCASSACNANPCAACEIAQPCCSKPCGPFGRVWVSAEYLLWWTDGFSVPALVTASPAGTPRTSAGVLGQPNTRVLFGDDSLNDGVRSGFRLRIGGWLDNCQTCGLEGSYFFLGDANDTYSADCTDNAVLARPFINVRPRDGRDGDAYNDSELICYPGVVDGRIAITSGTSLSGFDVNVRKNLSCDCCNRIDALFGFRYLKLDDDLTIAEDLTTTEATGGLQAGTRFQLYDSFITRNEFYGGQIGLVGEHRRSGGFFVGWRVLVGLGTTHKEATIDGATTITPPGGTPTTYAGGLLALPTNIGRYTRNDFSVVPEVGLNLGYQVSQNVRVFLGYSFLYWSDVTRPGDIIDVTINSSQLPPNPLVGPARPVFSWNDSSFWAQGVNFGAEFRY